jgi:histidyl-tRNA synthetase
MTSKPNKLKARLPRGLSDRGPAEIAATRRMIEKIREVFERYGFEPVETPAFEYTDALGKFLPDQDRPNEGVFSFQDDDEQWLSLRYDLTAPLARYVAENFQALASPYRSYRYGWVFRNEKPGPGRFRQFMQFDADTVGSASPAADAEMCMMAADTMEALGIPRGSYVVKVNNRKVLDGVLESIGLGGDENAGRRLTVLRAIDKLDRLGVGGVQELLGSGRKDESGDFTRGAHLNADQIDLLVIYFAPKLVTTTNVLKLPVPELLDYDGPPDDGGETDRLWSTSVLDKLSEAFLDNKTFHDGLRELTEINRLVGKAGYGDKRIRIDNSVVRGLEYYTGLVYEAELTFEIAGDDGKPVRFGSVGGGGRYDGLVARFRGEQVPATGFSIGVSRLLAALKALGKSEDKPAPGPVVVVPRTKQLVPHCMRLVQQLREARLLTAIPGFAAELYLGGGSFKGGLSYANRRNCDVAIMIGESEAETNRVVIKDLYRGAELAKFETERSAHLQRQAEAQRLVREDELVDEVRALLTRRRSRLE